MRFLGRYVSQVILREEHDTGLYKYIYIYTLWLFNIAMENHHF